MQKYLLLSNVLLKLNLQSKIKNKNPLRKLILFIKSFLSRLVRLYKKDLMYEEKKLENIIKFASK